MYLLVGKEGCSRCEVIKKTLTDKQIGFNYLKMEEIDSSERQAYLKVARENKMMELPLIFKNNTIISIDELIENIK